MKQNSLILSLVGGGVAFICLFLPWVKFDRSLMPDEVDTAEAIIYSGFKTDKYFLITLAFIAALAILGLSIYTLNQKMPWKSRTPLLISGGIGFLCVLLTLILFTQSLNSSIKKMSDIIESANDLGKAIGFSFKEAFEKAISLQFGGFGATIGFIVAIIGACNIPKSDISMKDKEQEVVT